MRFARLHGRNDGSTYRLPHIISQTLKERILDDSPNALFFF